MEWKQVTSDAQGGTMLPMMNMETKSLASMDATTVSQEQLFFKRVTVRYFVLMFFTKTLLHYLSPRVTIDILFVSKI